MENLLSKLKAIKPNKDFSESSKAVILSSPQLESLKWEWPSFPKTKIMSLSTAALIVIIGLIPLFNNFFAAPAIAENLNPDKLSKEAVSLDIQIQLSQAKYYQDSAKQIEVALLETSDEQSQILENSEELDALLKELTL